MIAFVEGRRRSRQPFELRVYRVSRRQRTAADDYDFTATATSTAAKSAHATNRCGGHSTANAAAGSMRTASHAGIAAASWHMTIAAAIAVPNKAYRGSSGQWLTPATVYIVPTLITTP